MTPAAAYAHERPQLARPTLAGEFAATQVF